MLCAKKLIINDFKNHLLSVLLETGAVLAEGVNDGKVVCTHRLVTSVSKLVTGMGRTKGVRLTSVYDPISERDFIDSIDKAIRQADMGNYQEADDSMVIVLKIYHGLQDYENTVY